MRAVKQAVMGYKTANIGDDMQSLAAERFFAGDVVRLNRDRLDSPLLYLSRYKAIMNGWFMSKPKHWPPVRTVDPLVISFHVSPWKGRKEKLLGSRGKTFFEDQAKRGGVGARDLQTLRSFQDAGIDAYFSGCLTMTLKPPRDVVRTDDVYLVDLDPAVEAKLRATTAHPFKKLTHNVPKDMPQAERLQRVRNYFQLYCGAKAVITSRIHAAFPSLAVGTPVLMIHKNPEEPRFGGIVDHLHFVSNQDFLDGRTDFDPADPPPNKNTHLALVSEMERRCAAFVAAD